MTMPFASGLSRYTIAVVGLLLISWAATDPAFRDQGHLNARICLPIALADVQEYVAEYYNSKRLHSTLGYKTPMDL